MKWTVGWCLLALFANCHATLTLCDDGPCRCERFTRVICQCTKPFDEVTLRPDGANSVPTTATDIIINNCSRVYFLPSAIDNLISLRSIRLNDNRHVFFDERSVSWSHHQKQNDQTKGLAITIQNCTINDVASHAFKGRIDDIIITGSRIYVMRPFAFSSLTAVKNIELTNNVWGNIEIQTFKKFSTLNFVLRGGDMNNIPSRFLSDIEITNLLWIDGVHIRSISSMAFLASSPKRVLIENNIIDKFEGDAFHISTRGPVTFRNNTIFALKTGALLGFSVDRDIIENHVLQELTIGNNTVTDLAPSSLIHNRSSFVMRVDVLHLNSTCACELFEEWKELINQQGGTITCWYATEVRFVSLRLYVESKCGSIQRNFWIIIAVIVALSLIILVTVVVMVRKCKEKERTIPVVVPDGKTYKETVIETYMERVDLLTTDL